MYDSAGSKDEPHASHAHGLTRHIPILSPLSMFIFFRKRRRERSRDGQAATSAGGGLVLFARLQDGGH